MGECERGAWHAFPWAHTAATTPAHPPQTAVTASRTHYAAAVGAALRAAEDGDDGALRAELARQSGQLADLIAAINSPITPGDRKKLITLCTVDVHVRDVGHE